jgi:hypothetical protein
MCVAIDGSTIRMSISISVDLRHGLFVGFFYRRPFSFELCVGEKI